MLRALLGSLAQPMYLANPLVPRVSETEGACYQSRAACFEQLQIVDSSRTESGRDDFAAGRVCQDLGFERVSFLFAAVVISLLLLFLGRSIGDSRNLRSKCPELASTTTTSKTTTSKTAFILVRDFLPGRVNLPDCIRASSTRLMVRQTVGSVTHA